MLCAKNLIKPGVAPGFLKLILCRSSVCIFVCVSAQGRSKQSGWSGFGRTTIAQGKNKVSFYKKQVIIKSTRVIFEVV